MSPPTGDSRFSALCRTRICLPLRLHIPHPIRRTAQTDAKHPIHRTGAARAAEVSQPSRRPPPNRAMRSAYCMAWGSSCITSTTLCRPLPRCAADPAAQTGRVHPERHRAHPTGWWFRLGQRHGKVHPLAFAAGKRPHIPICPIQRAGPVHGLLHRSGILRCHPAGKAQIREPPMCHQRRTVIPGTGRDCGINAAVRANSLRP